MTAHDHSQNNPHCACHDLWLSPLSQTKATVNDNSTPIFLRSPLICWWCWRCWCTPNSPCSFLHASWVCCWSTSSNSHTTSTTAGRGTRRGLPNSANKAPRLAHSASPVHPLTRCWSGETKFACCVFLACHTRRSRPDSQPRKPLLPVCRSRLCSSLQSHVTLSMCTFLSTLPAVVSIPICSHLAFRTRIASCVHDSRPISLTPSSS
jgi:hypothetical protein